MPGELEAITRQMFNALDRNDAESFIRNAAEDVQAVDEISRRWLRGVGEAGDYLRQVVKQIEGVRSILSNVREVVWGEAGVLTGWLEQDYTLEGTKHHISAPTTVVFRRDNGAWKIVVFESIPLPLETA
jgi:ketosteroid isomerase-like protein